MTGRRLLARTMSWIGARLLGPAASLMLFACAVIAVLAGDGSGNTPEPTPAPTPTAQATSEPHQSEFGKAPAEAAAVSTRGTAPIDRQATCLTDEAAVEDLHKRREELDARAEQLASKDRELQARERALNEELGKLEAVRDQIEKVEQLGKKENEEKIAKLVEMIETMSPKASARLINELDETLAVAAMFRIDTKKLSKIMNNIEPEKSSRLTEILAGVARAKGVSRAPRVAPPSASLGAAAAAQESVKGGERNGKTEQQQQSNSGQQQQQQQPGGGTGHEERKPSAEATRKK